jgi:hypothetical protein
MIGKIIEDRKEMVDYLNYFYKDPDSLSDEEKDMNYFLLKVIDKLVRERLDWVLNADIPEDAIPMTPPEYVLTEWHNYKHYKWKYLQMDRRLSHCLTKNA